MAARNRLPRHHGDYHDFRDGPPPLLNRGPGPLPIHPEDLEEEIEIQHRENQRIVVENRHLVDENRVLQRDAVAAKDEVERLGQFVMKLRADQEAQTRNLYERTLKLEADLRSTEPLRDEVMRLRAEAQKLNVLRQDLTAQIQGLSQDITHLRSENKQLTTLKADADGMRKQLVETRRALQYEKKINEEQVEQNQSMEKNLMTMAREVEKLRVDQLNMDRTPHGLGGGSYGMYNGNPDTRYQGGNLDSRYQGGNLDARYQGGNLDARYQGRAYGEGYARTWGTYDHRAPPRR